MSSRIPKRELLAYREESKRYVFRQIHQRLAAYKAAGGTHKDIADRIDMDEGQFSKILKGDRDLRSETLSDIARALDCRIRPILEPLVVPQANETIPVPLPHDDSRQPAKDEEVSGGSNALSFGFREKAAA